MQEGQQQETGGVSNRDVARGAGTTLLARLGGVLDVLTQPLYVWLFGLAGYGFYGALWAMINLVENVADLGMTVAMQRVVPQAKSAQEEASALRASFILALVPCFLIALLVALLAEPVAGFFNTSEADAANVAHAVRWFVWALPLWAFVEISTSALRSKRLFGAEIRLRLLWEQLVRLGFVLAFYAAGFGIMALFYGHLMSLCIICILCVRLLNRHFELRLIFKGPVRDAMFGETLKAGLAVLPVNIVSRLFSDGPAIGLNALLPGAAGAVATSLFIIARKISSIVQLVRTAFGYVLAPLASAASARGKGEVAGIYGFSTRLSLALALPLGSVLAAMGSSLLPLFGPGAEAALFALIVLIAARVIEAVFGAAAPIQQVTSALMHQKWGSLVGLGVAGLIVWSQLAIFGVSVMAVAVAVGLVIAAVLPLVQLHLIDKLHPFAAPFGSVLLKSGAAALVGASLVVVSHLLPFAALRVGVGLLVLVIALWASLRWSLPRNDRLALGEKTAERLRLI